MKIQFISFRFKKKISVKLKKRKREKVNIIIDGDLFIESFNRDQIKSCKYNKRNIISKEKFCLIKEYIEYKIKYKFNNKERFWEDIKKLLK